MLPLLDRLSSGLTHLLVSASLSKTPYAALSRPVTGIRKKSIILTVPGSPKGARENVEAVLKILPHAVELACGGSGASVHDAMQYEKSGESEKGETREYGHDCVHHRSHGHSQHHAGEKKLLSNPLDAPGIKGLRIRACTYSTIITILITIQSTSHTKTTSLAVSNDLG